MLARSMATMTTMPYSRLKMNNRSSTSAWMPLYSPSPVMPNRAWIMPSATISRRTQPKATTKLRQPLAMSLPMSTFFCFGDESMPHAVRRAHSMP